VARQIVCQGVHQCPQTSASAKGIYAGRPALPQAPSDDHSVSAVQGFGEVLGGVTPQGAAQEQCFPVAPVVVFSKMREVAATVKFATAAPAGVKARRPRESGTARRGGYRGQPVCLPRSSTRTRYAIYR
jgi:hypothetical protein